MAVLAHPRLLTHEHFNKSCAVFVFLQFFKERLLCLVIEHPMQCPSRLNLQTSMQGLGVLGMGNLADVWLGWVLKCTELR